MYLNNSLIISHSLQDTVSNGYLPPSTTVIILAVSLGVTYVALQPHRTALTFFFLSPAQLLHLRNGKFSKSLLVGPYMKPLLDHSANHKMFPETWNRYQFRNGP